MKPLITLAIRHFNNARFVTAALDAAFAQTYDPLEILFVDDFSSDGGFEIARHIAELSNGPHRIRVFRNQRNLGCGGQTMRVRELMQGEIVVFADADDVSLPDRCERLYEKFVDPDVLAATSYFDFIDADGKLIDNALLHLGNNRDRPDACTLEMLARGDGGTVGAVLALRSSVLDRGIALDHLPRGDDLVSGFRAALLGRIATVPSVLVHRRVHLNNVSVALKQDTPRQMRKWHSRSVREGILIPASMRRDLLHFVREGAISERAAQRVFAALAKRLRSLKLQRVAERLSPLSRWLCLWQLYRCDIPLRTGLRLLLPAISPRLEFWRTHRLALLRRFARP